MASIHGCHPKVWGVVMEINRDQRRLLVQRLREMLDAGADAGGRRGLEGREIGVLGLSFKPGTDDVREAPSLEVIHLIESEGGRVRAYDPAAMERVRAEGLLPNVQLCHDPYEVAQNADALVIVTEWNEFKNLDMQRIRDALRQPIVVDGRNIYDYRELHALGFKYWGVGRSGLSAALLPSETVDSEGVQTGSHA